MFGEHAETVATSEERASWLAARRTGIGASEIAGVLGIPGAKVGRARVWGDKRGIESGDDPGEIEHVQWGNRLEPVIARAYSEPRYAGRETRASGILLRSRRWEWMLATLDAITLHPDHGWIPLEIKTAAGWLAEEWAEGPPAAYWWQVQQQIAVTGARCASIACLLGGQRLAWCDIERDEAAIARIAIEGARFWRSVEAGELPDPDGSSAFRSLLDAMHPTAKAGSIVELPSELERVTSELERIVAWKKEHATREELLRQRIRLALGDSEAGILPDGRAWTCRTVRRGGFTVAPSEYRDLRATTAASLAKKTKKGALE